MKKILFMLALLVSVNAVAQIYPTQRVQYGTHTADIQPEVLDEHRANVNIKNPYGNEDVVVEVQEDGQGKVQVIMRDKNTGKVISTINGVEGRYADSVSEFGGVKQDIHLRQLNDDITGTVAYTNKNTGEEMFAEVLGNEKGMLNQTKKGYRMALKMKGAEDVTVAYTNAKTQEVICMVEEKSGAARVYDKNKKVIAEGISENDEPSKIYDKVAYDKCAKVMEIFNDDDDDE